MWGPWGMCPQKPALRKANVLPGGKQGLWPIKTLVCPKYLKKKPKFFPSPL